MSNIPSIRNITESSDPDAIPIQYQEICSDSGVCVVKIIPITPEPYEFGVSLIPIKDTSKKGLRSRSKKKKSKRE